MVEGAMRDWNAIAIAVAPEIPAKEVAGRVATLQGLEEALRPLADGLGPEDEPATGFDAADGEGA